MNCLHFTFTKKKKVKTLKFYSFTSVFISILAYTSLTLIKSNTNNSSMYIVKVLPQYLSLTNLLLLSEPNSNYFVLNDLSGFFFKNIYYYSVNIFNIFLNQRFLFLLSSNVSKLQSLSSIYFAATWLERELAELDGILFYNLKDTRRLLQDYTLYTRRYGRDNSYKNIQYNTLLQDLLKVMLCWNIYFLFFISIIFLSFIYVNKSFIQLLLLTELIIICIFLIFLSLSVLYNTIYLINLGLILLILGGLELALSFLLLTL